MESEIVEHKILHLECTFDLALRRQLGQFQRCQSSWGGKSYDKLSRISVTVGDTENFTESEIVDREIVRLRCGLRFALESLFEMVLGAEVVLPCGQKLCYHAHPRPFHARGEGDEFDVVEDTRRVQENIHAKFHENRFSSVAVHRERTDTQPLL